MIERVEVLSREELLLQTLTDLIQEVVAAESNNYSTVIAEVYAEFMRELLVEQAESAMGLAYPESLLSMATVTIEQRVKNCLGEVQFFLSRYKDDVWRALKVPAKELLELQEYLKQTRWRKEIPTDTPVERGEHTSFWIAEVGLQRSDIQELIAFPCDRQCYLDFSQLLERYLVRGDWFPFEVLVQDPALGEIVFVVDQDGSIHTHTENFPTEAVNRMREILKFVAGKVYVANTDHHSERGD